MSRTVLFDGYYGMQNTGDDVFCVIAADLASRTGHLEPGFLADRLPVLPTEGVPVLARSPQWRGGRRFRAVIATADARAVVHLGGSTMRRMNTHRRDQQALERFHPGVTLHAAGISVGPFRSSKDERAIGRYLRRFRTVSVRDAPSAERVRALGLSVVAGFDVAVLLPELAWAQDGSTRPALQADGQRVLGVSVCPVESEGPDQARLGQERVQRLAAALRRCAGRTGGMSVRVLEFNGHPRRGDAALSRALAEAVATDLPVELVPYEGDVRETVAALRGCHGMLGMRLHSAILAFAYDVPFALVDYHPKCREFGVTVGLDPVRLLPSALDNAEALGVALDSLLEGDRDLRVGMTPAEARALAAAGLEHLAAALRQDDDD